MAKKKFSSLEAIMAGEAPADETIITTPQTPTKSVEKLTVYVPRAAAKRIKQMALDHDRRVNDFLQEGVNLMLARYGEPPLEEFDVR
jgi:hypothetical protein